MESTPGDDKDQEHLAPKCKEIMDEVESSLPRVGKNQVDQPSILQKIQAIFPEKIIKGVIACKGTERTMAPPSNLSAKDAPYRRSIMKLRSTGKIVTDQWEKYDELAKRKIIRKSYPCRVNITVFAANPAAINHSQESSGAPMPAARPESSPNSRMEVPNSAEESERMPEVSLEPLQPGIPETSNNQDSQKAFEPESQNPMEQGDNASKNNRFLALPREEQAMLRRAHPNLCHPSPEQLSMVLRNQGVRPEISQAVFDMKCATCASQQKPKIARPSTLKHELDFNDRVFIDGATWKSKAGKMFHVYHILDQATNFHVAVPAPSRAAEQAAQCVSESWFQWAGPPKHDVNRLWYRIHE